MQDVILAPNSLPPTRVSPDIENPDEILSEAKLSVPRMSVISLKSDPMLVVLVSGCAFLSWVCFFDLDDLARLEN